ncbi:MAG TPA: hypothetical protein P5065_02550 [Candidatus Ratteibacteria bacterium]|jgi:hypothetical protein|nr:hypothetical protein [bacterium]HON06422.1 hypothetical protein [bacterium]HPC29473.1 hypothetical protein [bacterium]HRS05906.1 hypothetical protein [Candidatus Ratteibacteria bacterium]HRV05130.1 hypothetical protein [Candidatus Ratteibacteria bacterium]
MKRIRYLFNRVFSVKIIILCLLFCANIFIVKTFPADIKKQIVPEDIFSQDELNTLSDYMKLWWLPITQEFQKKHTSKPPDIRLFPSFIDRFRGVLKEKWHPDFDIKKKVIYLKVGEYDESAVRSFFYLSYLKNGHIFDLKGFYHNIVIMIKSMTGWDIPEGLVDELHYIEEKERGQLPDARRYKRYKDLFPERELPEGIKNYIRQQCEFFLASAVLPASEPEWEEIFKNRTYVYNGGLALENLVSMSISDSGFFPNGKIDNSLSVWTNGKIVVFTISGGEAYDNTGFIEEMAPPESKPSVEPLNPEDVEYIHTNQYSDSNGLAVSEESRASWTYIKIRFKKDTGVSVIEQPQPIHIPLTPIKWHICEYRAFNNAYHALIDESVYNRSIENNLCNLQTRKKAYEDMQKNYEKVKNFYLWFSVLKYPKELENVRNQQIIALGKLLKDWGVVYKFWEQVLEQFPEETERFYKNKARELDEKIKKEFGWTRSSLMKQLQDAGSEELSKIFRKIVLELP